MSKKPKTKKCKSCGEQFVYFSSLQKVCSVTCSLKHVRKEAEKEYKNETRIRRKAIKTRREWLKDVQTIFNRYIRERDAGLSCISCNRFHSGQYHAGHYKTVGANPELRFDERNCHKQCAPCNNHLSGNITNYRINLLKKIGVEAVESLEGYNEPKKYTIEELKELKKVYQDKLKELKRG